MPTYKNVGLGNMANGTIAEAPQHLPTRFSDDSVLTIPIPYSVIYPPKEGTEKKGRKGSFLGKLTGKDKTREGFKMVKMTRKEYLMYWYVLLA